MSNPKLTSTKAGVALSADARSKLQQLADWMELETSSRQDPRVQLNYYGGIMTYEGVTHVSPVGALVQMFQPFKLSEAKQMKLAGMHIAQYADVMLRFADILDLGSMGAEDIVRHIYAGDLSMKGAIQRLRTLK